MSLIDAYAVDFRKAFQLWRAKFDNKLSASGQTLSRALALYYLSEASDKLTQTELSKLLCLEGPTVARLLDGMEKSGMITREAGIVDRRVKYVALTALAVPVVVETARLVRELRMEVLGDIPEEKLKVALEVMHLIVLKLSETV